MSKFRHELHLGRIASVSWNISPNNLGTVGIAKYVQVVDQHPDEGNLVRREDRETLCEGHSGYGVWRFVWNEYLIRDVVLLRIWRGQRQEPRPLRNYLPLQDCDAAKISDAIAKIGRVELALVDVWEPLVKIHVGAFGTLERPCAEQGGVGTIFGGIGGFN